MGHVRHGSTKHKSNPIPRKASAFSLYLLFSSALHSSDPAPSAANGCHEDRPPRRGGSLASARHRVGRRPTGSASRPACGASTPTRPGGWLTRSFSRAMRSSSSTRPPRTTWSRSARPATTPACSTANAINTFSSRNDVVALNATGTRYFICGFPDHCAPRALLTMKIVIHVVSGSSSSSPASPMPAAGPGASSSPPAPPSSAATSIGVATGFGLVALLAAAGPMA